MFNFVSLQKYLIYSSFCQQKFSYFSWIMRLRITNFRPCSETLKNQWCQKLLLVLTCFEIQTIWSYLLHFSVELLEAHISFRSIKEIVFYQNWNPDRLILAKCDFVFEISDLTVECFQMFDRWINQWFCPSHRNVDRLNMRKFKNKTAG